MYSDLYKDILVSVLGKHPVEIRFVDLKFENLSAVVENVCYMTLQRTRSVLDDDKLNDFVCIEQIVRLFEDIGSNGDSRHDF